MYSTVYTVQYIHVREKEAREHDLDPLVQTLHNIGEDVTNYSAKLANLYYVNTVCLCWTYIYLQQIKEHILCRIGCHWVGW